MDEEHGTDECLSCQLEAIAHYADVIREGLDMEIADGLDRMSGGIMRDIARYWIDADTEWLCMMVDNISVVRLVTAPPGMLSRVRGFFGRWF